MATLLAPHDYDYEAERLLAVLAGEPAYDCMFCGRPLAGDHDGWAHNACTTVTDADREACEVHTNDPLSKVERRLRRQGTCPHQVRAPGWDGGGVYCGRDIEADRDRFCPEHQCEWEGDEIGGAEAREDRTLYLLGVNHLPEGTS